MKRQNKFLSFVLRHNPDEIGITLDAQGWTDVERLLVQATKHGLPITREELDAIVAQNDKMRFTFSADGTRIRADGLSGGSLNLIIRGSARGTTSLETVAERRLTNALSP
ncbi:RNA 2'-phosphotransferase [Roseovarius albus]|nr:RNA 2'-phosphotransferase [Roseovarius albus]